MSVDFYLCFVGDGREKAETKNTTQLPVSTKFSQFDFSTSTLFHEQ